MDFFNAPNIAIDLGTENTLIFVEGRGLVINEPSICALNAANDLLAVGKLAFAMEEKSPSAIQIARPIAAGVVVDVELAIRMIQAFLKTPQAGGLNRAGDVVLSLPRNVSSTERYAFEQVAGGLTSKKVYLIDEPLAAAVGAGRDVLEPKATMIVDIGHGIIEAVVISLGEIVSSASLRVTGRGDTDGIVSLLKGRYHFAVGKKTAERVKRDLVGVDRTRAVTIKGMSLERGMPGVLQVPIGDFEDIIHHRVLSVEKCILDAWDGCSPELVGDLVERGILLSGGGALLAELRDRLQARLGISVTVVDQPLECVLHGNAKFLSDEKLRTAVARY